MRFSLATIIAAVSGLASAFSASGNDNVVLYWGQNSAGTQQSLGTYCQSTDADMYVISFLTDFPATGMNIVGCDDTFSSGLLHCSSVAEDIKTCQGLGKKILLSLGGAVGSYGFSSDSDAESYAETLWNTFGGGTCDERPFDDAVVDGFDLDIENGNSVGYAALTTSLREKFNGGSYYISGAPQCVYPDASLGDALENGYFDFVFVQFYNNPCGVDKGDGFNWDTWKDYAASAKNSNVKIYLGIPASSSAAGSGYSLPSAIETIVSGIKDDSCFGGIMMWDASQAFSNEVDGSTYCAAMKSILGGSSSSSSSETTVSSAAAVSSTVSSAANTFSSVVSSAAASAASSVAASSVAASSAAASSAFVVTTADAISSSDSPSSVPETTSSAQASVSSGGNTIVYITAPSQAQTASDSTIPTTTAAADSGSVSLEDSGVVYTTVYVQNKINDDAAAIIDNSDSSSAIAITTAASFAINSIGYNSTVVVTQFNDITSTLDPTTVVSTVANSSSSANSYVATTATTQYVTVVTGSFNVESSSDVESTSNAGSSVVSSVSAIATAAAVVGSGTGSVIQAKAVSGVCSGKTGSSLSSCLNDQFSSDSLIELSNDESATSASGSAAASATTTANSTSTSGCTEGAVSCYEGKFALCNFNEWVYFECPATTICSAVDLDGENVVVGCNYESIVLAEQSSAQAASASATAARRMLEKRVPNAVYIGGVGSGLHRHHIHGAKH